MINQHFYIARLIARYLSDEIEEEEQAELTHLMFVMQLLKKSFWTELLTTARTETPHLQTLTLFQATV